MGFKSIYSKPSLVFLLRPVARFCLRNRFAMQDAVDALKVALVEVARQEMEREGAKINISRISAMTGVHRRDVRRIFESGAPATETKSFTSRVLGQWEQDVRFHDDKKRPRALSVDGEDSDFRKLVRLVSSDLNPATVAFELERMGAVRREEGYISIKDNAYIVQRKPDEGLRILARDAEDLTIAVLNNLSGELEVPNLHARTEYDNIYREALPDIKRWLIEQGTLFHKKIRDFLSNYDKDINPNMAKVGGGRVVLGTFSNVEVNREVRGDT